ncbi:MAG: hypothetical protein NZ730_06590 [Porticoccaceae bacterium]|nr:hypothetical protein [Porticoccaceae bacterium]
MTDLSRVTQFDNMTDYVRGEYDCVHGHKARDGETASYYNGYGDRYAQDANADWYSDSEVKQMRSDSNE